MTGRIYTQKDFDKLTERTGTNSIKWDGRERVFGKADIIPLWVADMDFETPEFIRDRIARRLEHPILGYTYRGPEFTGAFTAWAERRHGWKVDPDWISFMPGVVSAVSVAVLALTRPGDEVVIQPPVYHPFYFCVEGNDRKLVLNHLMIRDGRFTFDLERLKKQITPRTKMLILSSPHNPGGTVWTPEELRGLVSVCREHDILIVSDEIHSDLILKPNVHTPLLKIAGEYAHRIFLTMAPSKTFNLAGMSSSIVMIPDEGLRKKYETVVHTLHVGMGNIFGNEALQAAYEEGDQWLDELLVYLKANRDYIRHFIETGMPRVGMMDTEGTYLAWLDFSRLGMKQDELNAFLIHEAGVGLNDGSQFGPGGEGHMRLNFGCPRSILIQALEKMRDAINRLSH
jgi:cystathionine beta-lyase